MVAINGSKKKFARDRVSLSCDIPELETANNTIIRDSVAAKNVVRKSLLVVKVSGGFAQLLQPQHCSLNC